MSQLEERELIRNTYPPPHRTFQGNIEPPKAGLGWKLWAQDEYCAFYAVYGFSEAAGGPL